MSGNLTAQHPGRILSRAFMRPLKIDVVTLAIMIGLPCYHVTELVRGRRDIDSRTASRLGDTFGTGADFWLDAQQEYEAEKRLRQRVGDIRNAGVSAFLFGFQSRNGGTQQ